jgi:hypothetical protein
MKPRPSLKQLNDMLSTPWAVWNSVVYQDFYPESDRYDFLNDLRRQILGSPHPEMVSFIEFFADRKRRHFAKFRYLFGEYDFFQGNDGEFRCRAAAVLPDGVVKKCGTEGVEQQI